jgi:hypothetical protein
MYGSVYLLLLRILRVKILRRFFLRQKPRAKNPSIGWWDNTSHWPVKKNITKKTSNTLDIFPHVLYNMVIYFRFFFEDQFVQLFLDREWDPTLKTFSLFAAILLWILNFYF